MLPEPQWVPRLVVESVHLDQLREHGGLIGTRDAHGLEAALDRARNKWHYEPEADWALLAAAYAYGLARTHPFNDGNKRIAFLASAIFLGLNGWRLETSDDDVVATFIALAAGELDEPALTTWFRARIVAR